MAQPAVIIATILSRCLPAPHHLARQRAGVPAVVDYQRSVYGHNVDACREPPAVTAVCTWEMLHQDRRDGVGPAAWATNLWAEDTNSGLQDHAGGL